MQISIEPWCSVEAVIQAGAEMGKTHAGKCMNLKRAGATMTAHVRHCSEPSVVQTSCYVKHGTALDPGFAYVTERSLQR